MRDWSAVSANTGETGGGVFNAGTLVLKGTSRITGNTAYSGTGGGIHSEGVVTFSRHWRGTVCGNSPDDWGSVWVVRVREPLAGKGLEGRPGVRRRAPPAWLGCLARADLCDPRERVAVHHLRRSFSVDRPKRRRRIQSSAT